MSDPAARNELAGRPGIGHNLPPLADMLAEEVAPLKTRADELIAVARTSKIADAEDAQRVVVLVGLIKDHRDDLEAAHKERKQPYLDGGRAVDAAYKPVIASLTDLLGDRGALTAMLTEFENRRKAEAAREAARLQEEQRLREEEAARARAAADEAKGKGGGIQEELSAIAAEEEAKRLQRQAATLRPEPIRTVAGNLTSRRRRTFEIVDIVKALRWCASHRKDAVKQAINTIIGAHLASFGVDEVERAIERGQELVPGVVVKIQHRADVRG